MTERNYRKKESPDRGKKKLGAWLSALVIAAFLGGYALFILWGLTMQPELLFMFLPLWLLLPLAGLIGLFVALRQRLREIDGGEEDDAAQY